MYIDYRLGQRHRRSAAGVLVLRSCGTSQCIHYYFKVNLVNFWLLWYFLCIFPIKMMITSTLTPNTAVELPLTDKERLVSELTRSDSWGLNTNWNSLCVYNIGRKARSSDCIDTLSFVHVQIYYQYWLSINRTNTRSILNHSQRSG